MDSLLKTIGVVGVLVSSFIFFDRISSNVFNAADIGIPLSGVFLAIIIFGVGEIIKLLREIKSNTGNNSSNFENKISQEKEEMK